MTPFRQLAAAALALGLTTVSAQAATFFGEFWDASTPVSNIAAADAIIAGGDATATFTTEAIDFPQGSNNTVADATSLTDFLGSAAASLAGPAGVGSTTLEDSVFRFTGMIDLVAGDQDFTVGSDDGFRLSIGGLEIGFDNQRSFGNTTTTADAGSGPTSFELIYFERGGVTGVEFFIDGTLASPSAVPLPAGLQLMVLGLGALGFVARRRHRRV